MIHGEDLGSGKSGEATLKANGGGRGQYQWEEYDDPEND